MREQGLRRPFRSSRAAFALGLLAHPQSTTLDCGASRRAGRLSMASIVVAATLVVLTTSAHGHYDHTSYATFSLFQPLLSTATSLQLVSASAWTGTRVASIPLQRPARGEAPWFSDRLVALSSNLVWPIRCLANDGCRCSYISVRRSAELRLSSWETPATRDNPTHLHHHQGAASGEQPATQRRAERERPGPNRRFPLIGDRCPLLISAGNSLLQRCPLPVSSRGWGCL